MKLAYEVPSLKNVRILVPVAMSQSAFLVPECGNEIVSVGQIGDFTNEIFARNLSRKMLTLIITQQKRS